MSSKVTHYYCLVGDTLLSIKDQTVPTVITVIDMIIVQLLNCATIAQISIFIDINIMQMMDVPVFQ